MTRWALLAAAAGICACVPPQIERRLAVVEDAVGVHECLCSCPAKGYDHRSWARDDMRALGYTETDIFETLGPE